MAKNVKPELVSRNMSRITLHITCYATYHITYGLFGGGNAANFRSLQPAPALRCAFLEMVWGYFKKACAERTGKCLPPWKGARVRIRAATKKTLGEILAEFPFPREASRLLLQKFETFAGPKKADTSLR